MKRVRSLTGGRPVNSLGLNAVIERPELQGKALFAKDDSDKSPRKSARLAIRSIPTLLLMKGGREVKRQPGATQASQIIAWFGSSGG